MLNLWMRSGPVTQQENGVMSQVPTYQALVCALYEIHYYFQLFPFWLSLTTPWAK